MIPRKCGLTVTRGFSHRLHTMGGIAPRGIFHRYQLMLVTAYDVTECDSDSAMPIPRPPRDWSRQPATAAQGCGAWFHRGMPDKWVNHVWAHARVLWRVTRSPVGARGVFECAGCKETTLRMSHGRKTQFQLFHPGQCAPPYCCWEPPRLLS